MGQETTAADAVKREVTQRAVLKRERVLVLPEGVELNAERQKGIANALGLKPTTKLPECEAWVEVGEFAGHSKTAAIEAYAGKPGTPDAKQGAYRAPSLSSWQGGLIYDAPPQPLVQRRELED